MGANEPPYIGETMPGATVTELKPGMVFAVEPLVWVADEPGGRRRADRGHGARHR
jgi:methionine aminopeptidase